MKKEVTKYICDCCGNQSEEDDFIVFSGMLPFKLYSESEYGTKTFNGYQSFGADLCAECCEKLITDVKLNRFYDPETYLYFDERKGNKLI